VFDSPYFEPTVFDKGFSYPNSYVRPQDNSLRAVPGAVEGGRVYAETHLALARPQNLGTALRVLINPPIFFEASLI